ncbi:jg4847 [Pararge aegeria aegeria]|uniref:Jg4847 protein n=1 Tax=Pararge aegeria aegeria TaxID=348720 RepID=A0A8S4S1L4_9NEOP|nr:jg4847 [Pararge aegeria aegeria]
MENSQEGRLHMSKYKIRETQDEIQSLHALDNDVRVKYREIMDSLRTDLMSNEKECKKLQEQIEWVSRRRAELRDEVRQGQKLYGEAAIELATNLAELQRGRSNVDPRVTDKPQRDSSCSLRHRKEPNLPRASPVSSLAIKSPRVSNESIGIYRRMDI